MRIVCPIDFSAASDHAEREALELARALGAEVIFLHVSVETPPYAEGTVDVRKVYEAQRKWATERLGERVQAAAAAGVTARTVLVTGVPFDVIVRAATEEAADHLAPRPACRSHRAGCAGSRGPCRGAATVNCGSAGVQ